MQLANNITENPLKGLGYTTNNILPDGGLGAVLARAGVGKTSLMVQMALNAMMRKQAVLHISLDNPIKKIIVWYDELFQSIAKQYQIQQENQVWETILPFRFILTLNVDGFSVPRLEERIRDLIEQNIFSPRMIIIDGLPFDASTDGILAELKPFVRSLEAHAWLTVKTHRHQDPAPDGFPVQLSEVQSFFDTVIQLQPEGDEIFINDLKGGSGQADTGKLKIDPSTMLIQK